MANLGSLVNFLQEYGFVTHMGLVDFELQPTGILAMAVEPKIPRFDIFSRSISRKILYQMTLNCMDHLF